MKEKKKFYLSREDRIIWGVCGGFGEYFQLDSNIIRVIFIFLAVFGGYGALVYLLTAIFIPSKPA